jgi:hypothetical protein
MLQRLPVLHEDLDKKYKSYNEDSLRSRVLKAWLRMNCCNKTKLVEIVKSSAKIENKATSQKIRAFQMAPAFAKRD